MLVTMTRKIEGQTSVSTSYQEPGAKPDTIQFTRWKNFGIVNTHVRTGMEHRRDLAQRSLRKALATFGPCDNLVVCGNFNLFPSPSMGTTRADLLRWIDESIEGKVDFASERSVSMKSGERKRASGSSVISPWDWPIARLRQLERKHGFAIKQLVLAIKNEQLNLPPTTPQGRRFFCKGKSGALCESSRTWRLPDPTHTPVDMVAVKSRSYRAHCVVMDDAFDQLGAVCEAHLPPPAAHQISIRPS